MKLIFYTSSYICVYILFIGWPRELILILSYKDVRVMGEVVWPVYLWGHWTQFWTTKWVCINNIRKCFNACGIVVEFKLVSGLYRNLAVIGCSFSDLWKSIKQEINAHQKLYTFSICTRLYSCRWMYCFEISETLIEVLIKVCGLNLLATCLIY